MSPQAIAAGKAFQRSQQPVTPATPSSGAGIFGAPAIGGF
jgi:hypothetical protein